MVLRCVVCYALRFSVVSVDVVLKWGGDPLSWIFFYIS